MIHKQFSEDHLLLYVAVVVVVGLGFAHEVHREEPEEARSGGDVVRGHVLVRRVVELSNRLQDGLEVGLGLVGLRLVSDYSDA